MVEKTEVNKYYRHISKETCKVLTTEFSMDIGNKDGSFAPCVVISNMEGRHVRIVPIISLSELPEN